MVFKIKLEDKAAFESRLKAQNVALETNQIKDNDLEHYFEVDITNPKQLEIVKTILKQSPKINTIKEMKQSLTRSQLKEMVRKELQGVVNKKMYEDKDKKEKITLTLNEYSEGGELSYKIGEWAIKSIPAIADFFKGTPTGNGQEIADLGNILVGLATVGTATIGTGLAMYKDQIVGLAKKLKNALGGKKEGDDPELAKLADELAATL